MSTLQREDKNSCGRYGIQFDIGKAGIKPESQAMLPEIVTMLKSSTGLKLYVVGYANKVRAFKADVILFNRRTAAVVNALIVQYSIADSRPQSFDAGPHGSCAVQSDGGRPGQESPC